MRRVSGKRERVGRCKMEKQKKSDIAKVVDQIKRNKWNAVYHNITWHIIR